MLVNQKRKQSRWIPIGLIPILTTVVGVIGASSAPAATLAVEPNGPQEMVFSHARDACRPEDIPDAPARAFRDAEGLVHLFSTADVNYAFVGANLTAARRDCAIVFEGAASDDPARFDDREWLVSFWTGDGRTIHALVHNEFQGHQRPWLCPTRSYLDCWYNSVTAAVSTDRGLNFRRQDGGIVAAPRYPYDPAVGHPVGYFGASNIVRRDRYYYTMVYAGGAGAQKQGVCLFRNDDLSRVDNWRAWDGAGFTAWLRSPYLRAGEGPKEVCAPIDPGHLGTHVLSLVKYHDAGPYLALMSFEGGPDPGFYASTSGDLFHWTKPAKFLDNWPVIAGKCDHSETRAYASLLDPESPSRNFEIIGETAYLYFTRFNLHSCASGFDRDLVRIPVRIRPSP